MFVRALFAASVLLFSTSATASELPRKPTGKWVVHFDDAQCVAERNYGSESDPLYLVLKQPPLGNAMQLSIIEPGSARPAAEVNATLEFEGQPPQKVSVLRFSPEKMRLRVLMANLPFDQFSPARGARTLRVRTKSFDETLALVQLGPLLDVMKTCVADLRKVWNVGKSDDGDGAVREDANGKLRGLFNSEDYPWQALISGDRGTVKIALLVDETGKVADCSVMQTSGVAALDAQSCAVVKERATFTPAVGKDGKPAKDAFIQRITWRLK